ncbi:putative major head protein from prophage [Escherichia coli]|uniref:Putative major head protein from prophage n=1 Tax=Escherichia coli TaxID=562 RepID=A0A376MTJ9_ECOLX|nr:putative major head protein from prophage [Escherichia coli]
MVDLYSPTQLVQVVNAVDVQKQLNALFTSLFFTRSVMFESRDIILDTIDDPNIQLQRFVLLWWVVKFHVTKGTNQKQFVQAI